MELANKTALVTGAGQGVGQGIAFALASRGARVGVAGRTVSKLEATCNEIESRGGEALPVQVDVKEIDSLTACVERVVSHFGGLQILVNNAQQVPLGPLLAVDDSTFAAGWESGPLATHRLMRLCYPHLKGDGCIVNLASTAERRWDAANFGPYAAVKAAIRALTRAAASEWGNDGIRANVILPHAKSPGLEGWIDANPKEAAAFIATIPLGRIGECEGDIGEFVAVLCSDAGSYVSGQSIAIDGGQAYMP
jgi:NAD(P)-dependent dehydrogenase (short-subunit alcohol dehydrogenase family)